MSLQFAIFELTFHDFHRVFHNCIFYYMNYPDRVSTERFCSPNRKYVVTSKVFRFNCMVAKMWTELWPQRGKTLSNYRYKIDKPDISCIWCKINIILFHIMISFVGKNFVIIQELR